MRILCEQRDKILIKEFIVEENGERGCSSISHVYNGKFVLCSVSLVKAYKKLKFLNERTPL